MLGRPGLVGIISSWLKEEMKILRSTGIALLLLAACGAFFFANVVADPTWITGPVPPWSGSGMTEQEFVADLKHQTLPWRIASGALLAGALAMLAVQIKGRHTRAETQPTTTSTPKRFIRGVKRGNEYE